MTRDEFEIVEQRIEEELSNIATLDSELEGRGFSAKTTGASPEMDDSFTRRAVGSVLHDFYVCAENIFRLIARQVDESVPQDPEWHLSLLKQMAMRLPSRRPPVISKRTMELLNEFRAFRHVFRNVYGFSLSPSRLLLLIGTFHEAADAFAGDLRVFLETMKGILDQSDE